MLANKNNYFYTFILNNGDLLLSFCIFLIMVLIISNPSNFATGTVDGLELFFHNVFPGLFPFMFLTKLLTEIGFIFKISKKFDKFTYKIFGTPGVSLYAFFMSIISGYPIGAKIISDLYDKNLISTRDAKKMSVFCTTSGPIFVIGAVGNIMFKNQQIGIFIYVSHIVSTIIFAIFLKVITKNDRQIKNNYQVILTISKNKNIISDCITQTINSLLIVGAYITIFYLLGEVLNILKIFDFLNLILSHIFAFFHIQPELSSGTIYGLLEITRGCKNLSSFHSYQSVALCSALISFSGISIISQSMAFLKNTKIKTHNFVFVKIMHSLITYILCVSLLVIFRIVI